MSRRRCQRYEGFAKKVTSFSLPGVLKICLIRNKASNRKIFMRKKKGSYVLDVELVTKKDGVAVSLGKGEITVGSAAEESVCPLDWGGAFPLKESKKKMCFKTASGQDMQHYGERVVTCITQSKPAGFVRPS